MWKLIGMLAPLLALPGVAPSDAAHDEVVRILGQIAAVCEEQGLEACGPRIRGMDLVFTYDRAYRAMKHSEAEFVEFVRRRYEMPAFTMKDMAAHVDPKVDVGISRTAFDKKVGLVKQVPGGYDVDWTGEGTITLRLVADVWVAQFPAETTAKVQALNSYVLAANLKRAIMVYRMLEAQMVDYALEEFASRFVGDLTPLVAAVLRKPELIAKVPDWERRLDEVKKFYAKFESVDDMRADIVKRHRL